MTNINIYDKGQIREKAPLIQIEKLDSRGLPIGSTLTIFNGRLSINSNSTVQTSNISLRSMTERSKDDNSLCYIAYFELINLQLTGVVDNEFTFVGTLRSSRYTTSGEPKKNSEGDYVYLPEGSDEEPQLVMVTVCDEDYKVRVSQVL